jgi:hypothetical protein
MNVLDIELAQYSSAQIAHQRHAINVLCSRVFCIDRADVFVRPTAKIAGKMYKLDLRFFGHSIAIWVSTACLDTILDSLSVTIDDLSPDALELLLVSSRSKLPDNVQISAISSERCPKSALAFEMISYTSAQKLGWYCALEYADDFPLADFVDSFGGYIKGIMASPLASLPIAIPLIAAQIDLPANELTQLALGDVLLLGGTL